MLPWQRLDPNRQKFHLSKRNYSECKDRILIKNLYIYKGYGAKKPVKEFRAKGWKQTTINDFLKHFKETGSTARKPNRGAKGKEQFEQLQTLPRLITFILPAFVPRDISLNKCFNI